MNKLRTLLKITQAIFLIQIKYIIKTLVFYSPIYKISLIDDNKFYSKHVCILKLIIGYFPETVTESCLITFGGRKHLFCITPRSFTS